MHLSARGMLVEFAHAAYFYGKGMITDPTRRTDHTLFTLHFT